MEKIMNVLPTLEQIEWANCEMGVIIHYDIITYADKGYDFRQHWDEPIPVEMFNPTQLDTDQWVKNAADMGAKYAVLVAKHCTGFCLWPTKAYDYSVKSTKWKNGEGDIVADFMASCKKYGVKPGLYYSSFCNHFLKADNGRVLSGKKEEQEKYNQIVIQQLTELWTNYGEMFEIWFDGGCLPVSEGGPDITSLLHKLQPTANVFGGPEGTRSLLRWVGNERAFAPENCSSICNFYHQNDDGTVERKDCGDTFGDTWCPAESDRPNREAPSLRGGWFWQEDEEKYLVPAEELFEMYLNSVGHNTNMLIGMDIDRNGLFPQADCRQFEKFGKIVKSTFSNPLATIKPESGVTNIHIESPNKCKAKYLVIQEDISKGEIITGFTVTGDGKKICDGSVIGHKRIIPIDCSKVDIKITKFKSQTHLLSVELF